MTALTMLAQARMELDSPTEVRRAALAMQLREVDATPCGTCGHQLRVHSRISKPVCKQWSHKKPCRCKGFDG